VRFGKVTGVIVILFGIFWAWVLISHSNRPIFIYLMNAYGYFAAGIAAMFLLGIFWWRATHAGALAAGALTVPLSAGLDVWWPMPFANRTGIVFWACIGLGILVSLVTTPKPKSELTGLIWNWSGLIDKPGRKEHPGPLWNPALWWVVVTVAVLFMYFRYA